QRGADGRFARVHRVYGGVEVGGARVLEQVAGCAGLDRVQQVVFGPEDGDHQHVGAGAHTTQAAYQLEAVDVGQAEVDQGHLGLQIGGGGQRGPPVLEGAQNPQPRVLRQVV